MSKKKVVLIICWIGCLLAGLGLMVSVLVRPDYKSQLIQDIKQNPAIYQEVIALIKVSNFAKEYDQFIRIDNLSPSLLDKLNRTVIKHNFNYLTISKLTGSNNIKVEFMMGKLNLDYYSYPDTTFPIPDSHSQTGFIETIGINKNWCIWIDHDYY